MQMQIALKKQAQTYFQSCADIESAHKRQQSAGRLSKFYTLLISHLLPADRLSPTIVSLHTAKLIDWPTFIDSVWAFSLGLAEEGALFKALAGFVAEIDCKNIVDRGCLMRQLPENLIDAANLQKKLSFDKRARGAYTKFYYDQKKHNLIRQNNQGYSKLCLLLATINSTHSTQIVWNKILSLIGNFDLDPDRVLDMLIESSIYTASFQIGLQLIKNFNPQSIVTLLGNRLLKDSTPQIFQKIIYAGKVQNFLMGNAEELYRDLQNSISPQLYVLICRLIKADIIQVQLILPYLNPSDAILEKQMIKKIQNGSQKIMKSFKLMMKQLTEEQQIKLKEEENLKFLGQMLYSSKLALLTGFVTSNDWYNFIKMWKNYQNKIDLIIYQPLLKVLLEMLEWIIDPLYSKISYSKFFTLQKKQKVFPFKNQLAKTQMQSEIRLQMSQIHQLNFEQFQKIVQIMQIVRIYIGFHTKIFTKICRLFTAFLKQPSLFISSKSGQPPASQLPPKIRQKIQLITKVFLFPGISLQSNNPVLPKEIYQLLQMFDYRFRYRCYLYHYSTAMTNNPYLANIFYKTRNKQIVIVNNLSQKNKKVFMKKMAKMTHNHALQAFYWIFRRLMIQDYEKVVPEVVNVLASCCSCTLQMSIFVTLNILNQQKQPAMNFKTGEQAPWFKNLINYISLFYRKYLEVDIQPVFDYMIMKIGQPVQELQSNEQLPGALLKLLYEILSKMFCNFVLKEVNKNKMEMLCAGPKLQLQAMDVSEQIKASKKSKVILQKFFWGKSVDQYDGQSLAISLLILLTQKRAELLHKSYISNIKIIGDIYDDFTILIIQLIRVLNQLSNSYQHYARLMPNNALHLMINQYRLPIQVAFQIYRPSIKPISTMNSQEWEQFVKDVGGVLKQYFGSEQKYINSCYENDKLKSYLNQNYTKIANVMPNQFFVSFWMLTLDSIYFPAKLYLDKIEETKKKAQTKPNRNTKNQKSDRQTEKAKTLLASLKAQQLEQQKKPIQTFSQQNASRLKVQALKTVGKDEKTASAFIQTFAQIYVQICLLPRMMLDPEEALYCMKMTLQVIKVNKLTAGKSIKFLLYVVEHVMSYLPYSTQRESAYCLAIFLSEMMGIISNWNDVGKLKQDLKKFMGIQQSFIEQSYPRLKKHFVKLFIRFGNIVKSIKDEPYCIRNCLFLLEKVDSVPAYKKQAQDLQNYLKQLKQKYSAILSTIIQRQLSIIGQNKKTLPDIEQQILSTATATAAAQKGDLAAQLKHSISPARGRLQNVDKSVNNEIVDQKQGKRSNRIANQSKYQKDEKLKKDYNKYDNRRGDQKHIQTVAEKKADQQRTQKQRNQKQKIQKQRLQKQKSLKQKAQKDRLEKERIQKQKIQKERLQKQKAQKERIQKERADRQRSQRQRVQKQKAEKQLAEKRQKQQKLRLESQKQSKQMDQKQKNQSQSASGVDRIKTVKQIRDQNSKKTPTNQNPSSVHQQNGNMDSLTEKMRLQKLKAQVDSSNSNSNQPNQNQRRQSNSLNPQENKQQQKSETLSNKPLEKISKPQQAPPVKESGTVVELLLKAEQSDSYQNSQGRKDNSRYSNYPKFEDKNKSKEWRTENKDKYSQEKNQREYKKDNSNKSFSKEQRYRERDDREDHRDRDKYEERNRKDSKDQGRRKQDKYERERDRDRKHDGKGKDRSRDRDYRK